MIIALGKNRYIYIYIYIYSIEYLEKFDSNTENVVGGNFFEYFLELINEQAPIHGWVFVRLRIIYIFFYLFLSLNFEENIGL